MNTNNLKSIVTSEQVRKAINETKFSNLSIDDKIVKLTSIKAEFMIALKDKGHRFVTTSK
jgi:hypothetical protein